MKLGFYECCCVLAAVVITSFALGGTIFAVRDTGIKKSARDISSENPAQYAEISTASAQSLQITSPATQLDLPIVVYHIVRPSQQDESQAVRAIELTPEIFDAEMYYLKTSGYTVVRFSDLEAHFKDDMPLPPKPIIISFDDGWSDQFKYAFPILKKYNYPATFFVFTNAIGRRDFLSWDNLRELLAAGMTIGDHTRSHPYLTGITDKTALWDEISGSKQLLERQLGVPIYEFAYPFGAYNSTTTMMVEKAGNRSARGDYSSGKQAASRLYELGAMNAPTTITLFEKKFPN